MYQLKQAIANAEGLADCGHGLEALNVLDDARNSYAISGERMDNRGIWGQAENAYFRILCDM